MSFNIRAMETAYAAKDWKVVLEVIRDVPEVDRDARLWFIKGHCHDELKENALAIGAYSTTLTMDPDYATAYYNRGNVYVDLKDASKATADYRTAKELFQTDKEKELCDYHLAKLEPYLDGIGNSSDQKKITENPKGTKRKEVADVSETGMSVAYICVYTFFY